MKRNVIILGGIVVAVIALWTAGWFVAAGLIRQNIEAQAAADGITAPRVTCATLSVGGYPFRFDVDCAGVSIASGDLTVTAPDLRASAFVYRPTQLLGSVAGPIAIADSFTGTRNAVSFSSLEASLRLDGWRLARLSISGRDVVWSDTLLGEAVIAQSPLVELHLLDIPEQHDAERGLQALAGYAVAQNVAWPALTLGDTNAEAEIELTGLPNDVRLWGDPALARAVQSAGGALKIVSIRGSDANAQLNAEGLLRLDSAGHADGQIDITSTGVAERIGPLLQEPWRTLVLGVPGPDGRHNNQLNFRGGALLSGLVPIATLPPLF